MEVSRLMTILSFSTSPSGRNKTWSSLGIMFNKKAIDLAGKGDGGKGDGGTWGKQRAKGKRKRSKGQGTRDKVFGNLQ